MSKERAVQCTQTNVDPNYQRKVHSTMRVLEMKLKLRAIVFLSLANWFGFLFHETAYVRKNSKHSWNVHHPNLFAKRAQDAKKKSRK